MTKKTKQYPSTTKRYANIKADYEKLIKTYKYVVVIERISKKYGTCERTIMRALNL